MFKYLLYKTGLFLLHWLPSQLFYAVALFISDLQCFLSFRDRRAVRNNLKNIVPSTKNLSFLTRDVFRNFGRYLIEFFQMREMIENGHFVKNKVNIKGTEHLDNALTSRKGVIIITAHIGNWELGAVLMSVLGYPLMAVALPHKERPVNDLFNHQREVHGVTVVPIKGAFRRCVEQLKSNKIVALVADRDFSTNGVEMDFLGRKAIMPKGVATLSWKTGAPIVPTFAIRNKDGTFDLTCYEPIYPPGEDVSTDEEEIILGIMRRYVSIIEEQIRAYPSQWLLFREFSLK